MRRVPVNRGWRIARSPTRSATGRRTRERRRGSTRRSHGVARRAWRRRC